MLHLAKGENLEAEKRFELAKKNGKIVNADLGRFGWLRARVRLGKTVQTYRELGADMLAFNDLANQCFQEKKPEELASLLAAHRQAFPKAKNLSVWDIEVRWLKKDYAGVLDAIEKQRASLLAPTAVYRWKCESYLIRSLIGQQKYKEAVKEAEGLVKTKSAPHLLMVLALASANDEAAAIAYLDKVSAQRYLVEDCYYDEDLGSILRGKGFAQFRARFAEPPPREDFR